MYYPHTKCRACSSKELVEVLNLGSMNLANDFVSAGAESAGMAPLKVLFCRTCTLAQLSVVVKPEILYRDYPYVTSDSHMMKVHFETLQTDIVAEFPTGQLPKKWLEIGSNNGAFLESLHRFKMETLGMEPARNLAAIAEQRGVKTIEREFNCPSAIELGATGYRADVIVARHVFAHIDDWQGFMRGLEMVSHKDTLVVIEVPYVGDMLDLFSWDQIYHEHLSYVSIGAIDALLKPSKFFLSDVKRYPIHGGSVALFLRRKEHPLFQAYGSIDPIYDRLFENKNFEMDFEARWRNLDALKLKGMVDLVKLIAKLKGEGKKICGFGASAKATVWLNAIKATRDQIQYVVDGTEQKQGKFIPGTDIPVAPENTLHSDRSDYVLNFAWNFHAEIAEKHKAFTARGGKWISVIPEVKIL